MIKDFAEEFRIKIEMKQIGARQEAGLIGGLGVCGRPLCCSRFMADFQSITTQAARCQDLSLNPQKLAGQCSTLKCCVNYEASLYIDAQNHLPQVKGPLEFNDGQAYLMKSEVLKGLMYFSYDPDSMANLYPLSGHAVKEIIAMNRKGIRPESIQTDDPAEKQNEFISAVGDDSISRFDDNSRRPQRCNNRKKRYNNRNNSNNNSNNNGNKQ